jgi:hypothetical protein
MSDDNTPLTRRQKIGLGVFVLFVLILPSSYWNQRGSLPLVGALPIWLLVSVTGLAGALSFWLVAEKTDRRIGLLTGVLAGIGGPLTFHLVFGGDDRVNRAAGFFVSLAGMAPGILLGRWLARRAEKAKSSPIT